MDIEADEDGYVEIPREFWANFGDDFIKEAVNPECPQERRRLYKDHQTYENWLTGDFAVWFDNGESQKFSGIMFNKAEVDRVFPPKELESRP